MKFFDYFTSSKRLCKIDQSPSDIEDKFYKDPDLAFGKRSMTAEDVCLDPQFSYFVLHASYGDKWCILSFLEEFLSIQKNTKILASKKDRELIRIFIGDLLLEKSIVFTDDRIINLISSFISPISKSSENILANNSVLTQTYSTISDGFPANRIRHLHIVKYPYFCDLHLLHAVPYATLLKMLLCLPSSSMPSKPKFYSDDDRIAAESLINSVIDKTALGAVLFNVYNISHRGFDDSEILILIKRFEFYNIQVLVNITGHPEPDKIQQILDNVKMSVLIDIPCQLLALVSESLMGVFGIVGGAMNVGIQFSTSHHLTFYTDGIGFDFPLAKLFGGRYHENIWQLYHNDWPCLFDDRVVKFVDYSGSHLEKELFLNKIIDEFIDEINSLDRISNIDFNK